MMDRAALLEILEDLASGDIGLEEATRRAGLLEEQPDRYRCGSCAFFKSGGCYAPGRPARAEHPHSVRCGDYQARAPHAGAMLIDHKPAGNGRRYK